MDLKKRLIQLITSYYFPILELEALKVRSCLPDRSQFVSINGFNSECRHTKYGAPRGYVLEPLFFLIHYLI